MIKFPLLFCDATEISNMAAVGNNKSILGSSQNSLVMFTCTFKVVAWNILAAF